MEAQLDRLETAVHNVTMRLMSMGKEVQLSREKVVSIEAELGRRKKRAAETRAHGNKRKQGPLTVPTSSFRSDMRLLRLLGTRLLRVWAPGALRERLLPLAHRGLDPAVQAGQPEKGAQHHLGPHPLLRQRGAGLVRGGRHVRAAQRPDRHAQKPA